MKQRNKHPSESHAAIAPAWRNRRGPAFLFDLDGMARWSTAFYQHVLAWREALEEAGIDLSVWRIHRRIGMSGGLFHALLRETRRKITPQGAEHLQKLHAKAYAVCHTSATVAGRAEITQVSLEDQRSLRHRDQRPHGERRRSEEHTSELLSHSDLVCRLLLEKKKQTDKKQRSEISNS